MRKPPYDKITDFLIGSLNSREQAEVCSALRIDPSMRKQLNLDSGFEASLQELMWGTALDENSGDNTWAEVCVPVKVIEKEGDAAGEFTDEEWNEILESAFREKTELAEINGHKLVSIIPFRSWSKLFLAACLIGVFISGEFLIDRFSRSGSHSGKKSESYLTQNVPVAHKREKPSVAADLKDTLILEQSTKMIVDRGSKFLELARKDSLVVLTVAQGTVDFSVEKKRYRSFVVVTPFAKIVVAGTVFRVSTGGSFTYVKVAEGSVRIEHTVKDYVRIALAGDEVIADADSLIRVTVDNSGMLSPSSHTLSDETALNSLRTAFRSNDTSKAGEIYNLMMKLQLQLTNKDLLTFEYAEYLRKNSSELETALALYEKIVEEYPSSSKLCDAAYWAAWCLIHKVN